MKKTMFEKLQTLNELDTEKGSMYLQICGQGNVISVDKKGNHGEVKIGVPENIPIQVMQGKDLRFILMIVDGQRYDSLTHLNK